MADVRRYTDLVTSEHATKPKFIATLSALVGPAVDYQNFLRQGLAKAFDLDTAIGVQLDQVGLWVGRSRAVSIPLADTYFSWDDNRLGWDSGVWQGPYDPVTGITSLDDDTYRNLLRAKIVLNATDGTITTAIEALELLFSEVPGTLLSVKDNQDMTMTVGISGVIPPAIYIALLQANELVIAPEGVGIDYVVTSVNTTAIFGWDVASPIIGGWDVGAWAGTPSGGPGQVTQLVKVSVTSGTVTLSWLPVNESGVTYQIIYKQSDDDGPYTIIGQPTNATLTTIGALSANTTYSFAVYAVNDSGAGTPSPAIDVTTALGGLAQVQGLSGSAVSATAISLTWDSLPGAPTYTVQYRPSGTSNFTVFGTTQSTGLTVTGLASTNLYDFKVYASIGGIVGPASTVVTLGTVGAVPGQVPQVQSITVNPTDVLVEASPPTTGATPAAYHFQFAQNVQPIVYQPFNGTVQITSTGAIADVTGLVPGTQYLIVAYASNLAGNGPLSPPLTVTTGAAAPGQVGPLKLVSTTPTQASISWGGVVGATQYQVQFRPDGTATWTNGPLVTATNATITGLTSGLTYDFRVFALT
jgi:fibronectin type 3 domain-containing protein